MIVVAWPEGIVLGVIGRRADASALAWATGLARRWSTSLHVIAEYHPPVGMYPHITTDRERAEARRAARQRLERQLDRAAAVVAAEPRDTRLSIVPSPRLSASLTSGCLEADLLLFSLAPTSIPLLGRRRERRARRIAAAVRVPASLGPGRTLGATVPT